MREIKLENITLNLYGENSSVRVKSNSENTILHNQSIESVAALVRNNFDEVYSYYKSKAVNNSDLVDVNTVSISIVLQYLYMYNSWRNTYKDKANIINLDLRFNEKDFSNPTTFDIIMSFYRKKYPQDWIEKCHTLLEMTVAELKSYYEEREKFYDK